MNTISELTQASLWAFTFFGMLIAYLLGSIPFGVLFSKWFKKKDLRQLGSHNIGTANAVRVAGYKVGLLTLVADILKGAIPVWLYSVYTAMTEAQIHIGAHLFLVHDIGVFLIALSAILGHMFPVYFLFRGGGKGVATAFGSLAVISPLSIFYALFIYVTVFFSFKKASLASLSAVVSLLISFSILVGCFSFPFILLAVLLIFIRHRSNIVRLFLRIEKPFKREE